MTKSGRNAPCPCGSGRKYKHCCAVRSAQAEAHFQAARALHRTGRAAEAEPLYREALAIRPDMAEARFALADALRLAGQRDAAIAAYREAIAAQPGHAAAHNDLGALMLGAGDLAGAADCFRQAIALAPAYVGAHCNLGGCLLKQGDTAGAIAAFERTLALQPDHIQARHLRDALAGKASTRAPAGYIEQLFDGYAAKFDTHLVQALNYKMPEELARLLGRITPLPEKAWRILDLGCGTGLAGVALAPQAREIAGVDLSAAMLARAATRKLYARLMQGDLIDMLHGENTRGEARYDLVVAADVLVYLGDLQSLVAETRPRLMPGGYFLFSVEALDALDPAGEEDYRLNTSGRYAHARAYLERLAAAHGFGIRACEALPVRTENARPIQAWAMVWQRRDEPVGQTP